MTRALIFDKAELPEGSVEMRLPRMLQTGAGTYSVAVEISAQG